MAEAALSHHDKQKQIEANALAMSLRRKAVKLDEEELEPWPRPTEVASENTCPFFLPLTLRLPSPRLEVASKERFDPGDPRASRTVSNERKTLESETPPDASDSVAQGMRALNNTNIVLEEGRGPRVMLDPADDRVQTEDVIPVTPPSHIASHSSHSTVLSQVNSSNPVTEFIRDVREAPRSPNARPDYSDKSTITHLVQMGQRSTKHESPSQKKKSLLESQAEDEARSNSLFWGIAPDRSNSSVVSIESIQSAGESLRDPPREMKQVQTLDQTLSGASDLASRGQGARYHNKKRRSGWELQSSTPKREASPEWLPPGEIAREAGSQARKESDRMALAMSRLAKEEERQAKAMERLRNTLPGTSLGAERAYVKGKEAEGQMTIGEASEALGQPVDELESQIAAQMAKVFDLNEHEAKVRSKDEKVLTLTLLPLQFN